MEGLGLRLLDCRCRFLTTLFLVFASLVFYSCSSNSSSPLEDGGEGNYAPESVSMKNFRFYKGNQDKWAFEVYFGKEVDLITSSNYFVVDACDAIYEKTGKNMAHFWAYYTAYTFVGGNQVGGYTEYDLQLTFLSAHHGRFTGRVMSKPESEGESISGMFVFDSEKDLDNFTGQEDQEDSEEEEQETKFTLSSPTVENITTNTAKVKGTVYVTGDGESAEMGVCYGKKQAPTINDYHVKSSSANIAVDLNNLDANTAYNVRLYVKYKGEVQYGKAVLFNTKKEQEPNEDDCYVKISAINCNGSKHSVVYSIKYKDEENIRYNPQGVCYSTSPNPTITDYTVEKGHDMTGLKSGTVYYVRPYLVKDDKVYYFEETSFETIGGKMKLSSKLYAKIYTINYEIAMEGTYKFVLCHWSGSEKEHLGYAEKGKGTFDTKNIVLYQHLDEWSHKFVLKITRVDDSSAPTYNYSQEYSY